MMDYAAISVPLDTVLQLIVWANVSVAAAFLVGVIGFAICCGMEGRREGKKRVASRQAAPVPLERDVTSPPRVRRIRTVLGSGALHGILLLTLGLAACLASSDLIDIVERREHCKNGEEDQCALIAHGCLFLFTKT